MVDGNYCKTSSKEIMGSLCCPPIKEMTLVLANSVLLMLVFLSDTSSSHMPSLWSPANEVSYSVLILYWNPILPMMFSWISIVWSSDIPLINILIQVKPVKKTRKKNLLRSSGVTFFSVASVAWGKDEGSYLSFLCSNNRSWAD